MSTNIGLTKSKLGQSSIKTTVSRSMAGAQRSTGASSAMSTNKSIFATNFGIYARRSSTGVGNHFNYRLYNDGKTADLRYSLNGSRTSVFNNITEDEDNSNKGLGIAIGTMAGLGFLGALFGGLKEAGIIGKKEVVTDGTVESDSVSDSDPDFKGDTSALSAMSSANDSTTLRAAIDTAAKKRTEMQNNLTELNNNLDKLKSESVLADNEIKDLKPKIEDQKRKVAEKQEDFDKKKEASDAAQKQSDSLLRQAREHEKAVGEAATNYTNASVALANAEAKLASTPKTITKIGSNGELIEIHNTDYDLAKQAVEEAKRAVDEAKQKLDDARTNHENAVKHYEDAIDRYKKAAKGVKKKKKNLNYAKKTLEKEQENLNKLTQQQTDANNKIKAYNNALKEKERLEADIKKYDNEIIEQRARLSEMEKAEKTEYDKIHRQVEELSQKLETDNNEINTSDGLNFREKRQMRRNERNSERYAELAAKQKELEMRQNYTSLSDMSPEYTGVLSLTEFRKAEFGGETLYMIGGRPVTEQEYNTEIEKAKSEDLLALAPKINDPFAAIKSHEPSKVRINNIS